jgi:cell division protein FtsI (penicillin-binding protein 3)
MSMPDIEVPERAAPLLPSPWGELSTLTASFGHGIAVSPLQMVSAASSIVNGGILVHPTFVRSQNGHTENKESSEVRVVSPQTAHRMRQLLRLVVTDGTGGKADVPGFNVGGKTGTAEKSAVGGYDKKRLISSFLGVFPADAPRYAVYVMVDEPQGIKESYGYATAGWVAAPAVKNVIQSMVSILGLQPDYKAEDIAEPLRAYVKTKEQIKKEKHLASFGSHRD